MGDPNQAYKGTADFSAKLPDAGISFKRFSINLPDARVVSLEMECKSGIISGAVRVEGVPQSTGKAVTKAIIETALDRISHDRACAIEPLAIQFSTWEPVTPRDGTIYAEVGNARVIGHPPHIEQSLDVGYLKALLEPSSARGQRLMPIFRMTLSAVGPVEEFLLHYATLLAIVGDSQRAVDKLILSIEPVTDQTPAPPRKGVKPYLETVFTRIRNELGHHRSGVDLSTSRNEAAERVGQLRGITRTAIARL